MVLVSKPKRRSTPVTKRRSGHHHKKDEHYLKPYWPYIPMVLMVVVGLVFSNLWGAAQHGVLGYATDMSINGLLNNTNSQRTAAGLGSLALNGTLNQAAQAKANDMVARNYWAHNTPDGATPWTFFTAAGYHYQNAGENLAYGFDSSSATVTAWMNSPEHKANILGNYTEVGFGIANSDNYQGTGPETIIVAMYATPQATAAPTPTPAPTATKPAESTPAPTPAPSDNAPVDTPEATTEQKASPKPQETNKTASDTPKQTAANSGAVATKKVSRIQLLTNGQAAWSTFAATVFVTICLAVFVLRHGIFWHRVFVKGERFFMHHKFLDFILIGTAVIGFVLTRTAGVIH